jgi:competence protein ComEC
VLKVPHHGGGTSEQAWLERVGADLAVISVGPNDFGHPVPWVIHTLESSGAEVIRTDESGDVAVPLG